MDKIQKNSSFSGRHPFGNPPPLHPPGWEYLRSFGVGSPKKKKWKNSHFNSYAQSIHHELCWKSLLCCDNQIFSFCHLHEVGYNTIPSSVGAHLKASLTRINLKFKRCGFVDTEHFVQPLAQSADVLSGLTFCQEDVLSGPSLGWSPLAPAQSKQILYHFGALEICILKR